MVDKHSAPSFSIGQSSSTFKPHSSYVPGPGAYQHHSTIQRTTHGSITKHGGTQQRFKQYATLAPGPGSYNYQSLKQHIPTALVLSRSKQHLKQQQSIPGPGSYNPNFRNLMKSESGYQIGHSQKMVDITKHAGKTPGPGNYQTNYSTVKKEHAIVIGSQKRSDIVLNHFTPGPGQYKAQEKMDATMRHSPVPVFGKSSRSFSTSNLVPGPGAYVVPDKLAESMAKSKGFSISSKFHQMTKLADKVPGPDSNTEDLDKLKHKGISFSIGKSQKLKLQNEKEIKIIPGPQKYNPNPNVYFQSKNVIIGKEKRPSLGKETTIPGPGAYSAKLQSTLPNFSIPKSNLSWLKPAPTPGPGTYHPKFIEANEYNSIKITKDERRLFYDEKKDIPGPGSYSHVDINKSVGVKIGTQKRGELVTHKAPGPGQYSIPSTISNIPRYFK